MWRDGLSRFSSGTRSSEFGVRWVPVPSRGHRLGGALVSAVRAVIPRRGGAARRTWDWGRPRHRVPVGAALHPAVCWCGPAVPPRRGDRWYVDETYVKVAGRWRYVYRAIDQYGQVIDVSIAPRRDMQAGRRFFAEALGGHGEPTEVVTDRAWTLLAVVDDLMPGAFHNTEPYANNRIESDHGRLKSRLRPMRGLKRAHTARVILRGYAFMQNVRRGHYDL